MRFANDKLALNRCSLVTVYNETFSIIPIVVYCIWFLVSKLFYLQVSGMPSRTSLTTYKERLERMSWDDNQHLLTKVSRREWERCILKLNFERKAAKYRRRKVKIKIIKLINSRISLPYAHTILDIHVFKFWLLCFAGKIHTYHTRLSDWEIPLYFWSFRLVHKTSRSRISVII